MRKEFQAILEKILEGLLTYRMKELNTKIRIISTKISSQSKENELTLLEFVYGSFHEIQEKAFGSQI